MQKPNSSTSQSRRTWQKKNRLFGNKKKPPAPLEAESYFIRKNLLNVRVGRFEFLVRLA